MGEVAYEVVGDVARLRLAGNLGFVKGAQLIAQAIARTRDAGLDKLLVDASGGTSTAVPSLEDRYAIMRGWAAAGRGAVRVALVLRAQFIDPDRIGTSIGMNAGFVSKSFTSEPEALDWLLGHRGRHVSGKAPPP